MAVRPVFAADLYGRLCKRVNVEFAFVRGMAKSQKMKCSINLRQAFLRKYPERKVLEISRFSDHPLGEALSAFNLTVTLKDGRCIPVECAYQGGKIMEGASGPLEELYDVSPLEAKRDVRHSGAKIKGFTIDGIYFDLTPATAFYIWVYLHALAEHPEWGDELMKYDAFTDIVFNPEKSINCQAEACAYYVALRKKGLLEKALGEKEVFLEILYGTKK